MKNFVIKYGIPILLNLFIIALGVGIILTSLLWQEVPYNMQHWTKDLHTYLIYYHASTTAIMLLLLAALNIWFYFGTKDSK